MVQTYLRKVALLTIPIALSATGLWLSGCEKSPPAEIKKTIDDARRNAEAIQTKLTKLPVQCTLGDTKGVARWTNSLRAAPAPGLPYTFDFAFKPAIRANAFRVALNNRALQELQKVETRDPEGNWSLASASILIKPPGGCEFVTVAQKFASGEREITALRITLHASQDKLVVANASVSKSE